MTKDELIAKQQLEIEHLRSELAEKLEWIGEVGGLLFCIGGPLNDNKDGYTKAQLYNFWRIKDTLGL